MNVYVVEAQVTLYTWETVLATADRAVATETADNYATPGRVRAMPSRIWEWYDGGLCRIVYSGKANR